MVQENGREHVSGLDFEPELELYSRKPQVDSIAMVIKHLSVPLSIFEQADMIKCHDMHYPAGAGP